MNDMRKQRGGTILGMIIGLIIGLSIAVVVAITINKSPVPFVDRGFKWDKGTNSENGQTPDLNKSLYGNREPAKQAAKEFQKEAEDAAAAAAEQQKDKAPDATGTAKAAADKPQANGQDLAKADAAKTDTAKTDAAKGDAAKTDAAEQKWTYYLQAGAFREQADAENAKAKLALMGIETRISERTGDNGTLYRVRVGPFSQVDAMNKVRSKLSENGVDVAVVRIPG